MKHLLLTLAVALPALLFLTGFDRITGRTFASRSEVIAPHAMAATSQPLATQIALDVMKKGGSAVDAAIAANAALGLMEPTGNGIGGDLFAIVWDPETRQVYGLNASGRSPLGLSYDEMVARLNGRDLIPVFGALSVSVPGTVDGWFELHEKFGKLPMREVLQPAIAYAREHYQLANLRYECADAEQCARLGGQSGHHLERLRARTRSAQHGQRGVKGPW